MTVCIGSRSEFLEKLESAGSRGMLPQAGQGPHVPAPDSAHRLLSAATAELPFSTR